MKYSMISDLYNGNVGNEDFLLNSKKYHKKRKEILAQSEELKKTFDHEQIKIIDDFVSLNLHMSSIENENIFSHGLRVGAMLVIEIFQLQKEQEEE